VCTADVDGVKRSSCSDVAVTPWLLQHPTIELHLEVAARHYRYCAKICTCTKVLWVEFEHGLASDDREGLHDAASGHVQLGL
jgi:hypothetical protein